MSHDKKEMISFYITTRSDLDCIYCYTDKNSEEHKHQTLSLDFAKVGIDDYYLTDYEKHIRFFGAGEPTIKLELIKEILFYAKKKNAKTTSEIQTNGCFSESTGKWLGENIDIIWISSDGIPVFQNYYRPFYGGKKSSDILERNIKYLTSQGKGVTGIRMTITHENYNKQIENIDYFSNLGICNFWVDPIFPTVGENEPFEKLNMKKFTQKFIEAVRYAYSKGLTYSSILTCNFDTPREYACRALLPVPHLTTDGYVSACDMALFGKDINHMDVFIYGKWDESTKQIIYDNKKIEYLRSRKLKNISKCRKCVVGEFCRGYCPGEVVNETKDLFGCKNIICSPTIEIFYSLTEHDKKYSYFHP
jgi:uncharacterized protein